MPVYIEHTHTYRIRKSGQWQIYFQRCISIICLCCCFTYALRPPKASRLM